MDIEHLRYPIGKFVSNPSPSKEDLQQAIASIRNYPSLLEKACRGFEEDYLERLYRPGGWKVREVIHHIADSHMNAMIRFKLALTEDNPVIKPYQEQLWVDLPDSQLPISISVDLVKNTHAKWTAVLEAMSSKDFSRCYFHPESKSLVSLGEACLMYEWHGAHHLAHIHLPSLS